MLVRAFHPTFMYVIGEPELHILVKFFNHQNKFIFLKAIAAGFDPLFLDLRLSTVQKSLRRDKI